LVPASRRGVASSTFLSAIDLGIGIGAIITGYLAEAFGISTMFLVCGLSLTIPLLYFLTFAYRHYQLNHIAGR
ncbi:MAG: MFS transporter, partial [Cyclobacteriaceae bacterium]